MHTEYDHLLQPCPAMGELGWMSIVDYAVHFLGFVG
jgi:hypothetical protein